MQKRLILTIYAIENTSAGRSERIGYDVMVHRSRMIVWEEKIA